MDNTQNKTNIYNPDSDFKYSDELYVQIIKTYLDTESVKETAKQLNTTTVKVRKVLITEGLWSSRTSVNIQYFLSLGMNTAQIADKLSTTEKAVQQYLPYSKGIYKGDNPSNGALNTAEYRKRIEIVKSNTIRKSIDMIYESEWSEDLFMNRNNHIEHNNSLSSNPIYLHMELMLSESEYLENGELEKIYKKEYRKMSEALRQFGDVKYGDSISRDILVPGDMQLWALNYVIQRCFGWQNSHLHCFNLPKDQFIKICDNDCDKYLELLGVVFRSPYICDEDEFWADDYIGGSFKNWLRKKYTGPYESLCHGEGIWQSKKDASDIKKKCEYIYIEYFINKNGKKIYHWLKPINKKEYEELKEKCPIKVNEEHNYHQTNYLDVCTLNKLPLEALGLYFEKDINQVLERLTVKEVFSFTNFKDKKISKKFADVMTENVKEDIRKYQNIDNIHAQPHLNGFTNELIYNYDFGDNWKIKISASENVSDLIKNNRLTKKEYEDALIQLKETHRPVCIAQDGLNLLDDVGGVYGYVQFIKTISPKRTSKNEDYDYLEDYGLYENKDETLAWAKSLGWSKRKSSNKNLL